MFHIFFIRWINNQVLDAGWKKIEDKKSAIIFFYTITGILKLFIFKPKTHKTFFFLGLILKKKLKNLWSQKRFIWIIFSICFILHEDVIYPGRSLSTWSIISDLLMGDLYVILFFTCTEHLYTYWIKYIFNQMMVLCMI